MGIRPRVSYSDHSVAKMAPKVQMSLPSGGVAAFAAAKSGACAKSQIKPVKKHIASPKKVARQIKPPVSSPKKLAKTATQAASPKKLEKPAAAVGKVASPKKAAVAAKAAKEKNAERTDKKADGAPGKACPDAGHISWPKR